jgi:nucleoside-diphosphate-sugar epimerase
VVPRAVVLGGTGAIGVATAQRLAARGWDVTVTGRNPHAMPTSLAAAGVLFLGCDGHGVPTGLTDDADLVLDCICYTAAHARELVALSRGSESVVMISSKAVYVDPLGNHVNSDVSPRFAGPIGESTPTVAPAHGDHRTRDGYAANKVAAERVLLDSGLPVTILRASLVHGAYARQPRERFFIEKILAGQRELVLPRRGTDVNHTSAAANIAALVETVAARPAARVLNAADPDAPSVLEIARTVASLLRHTWDEVLLNGDGDGDGSGAVEHPWSAPHPIVLDTRAALALGYRPVGDYAATVGGEIIWLAGSGQRT